jgi:hypothetical protein
MIKKIVLIGSIVPCLSFANDLSCIDISSEECTTKFISAIQTGKTINLVDDTYSLGEIDQTTKNDIHITSSSQNGRPIISADYIWLNSPNITITKIHLKGKNAKYFRTGVTRTLLKLKGTGVLNFDHNTVEESAVDLVSVWDFSS